MPLPSDPHHQVTVPKTGGSSRIEQRWSTPAFSTEPIRKLFPDDSIAVSCGVVAPAFLQVCHSVARLQAFLSRCLPPFLPPSLPPQSLESELAAELSSKHCVDVAVVVHADFTEDAEAFVQRMPQVMPVMNTHTTDMSVDL